MIKFYGYAKCNTCKKAEKYLNENDISFKYFDITSHPPSKNDLKKILIASKKPIKKMFNTSGVVYRELKLKDKIDSLSESEMFEILASNGKLLKRPIAFDQVHATIGFNKDEYEVTWKS